METNKFNTGSSTTGAGGMRKDANIGGKNITPQQPVKKESDIGSKGVQQPLGRQENKGGTMDKEKSKEAFKKDEGVTGKKDEGLTGSKAESSDYEDEEV